MEILRKTDTTSLSATFLVSSSATHTLDYEDLLTREVFSASATPSFGAATFVLDSKYLTYTGNLAAAVRNGEDEVIHLTNIDVVRPYCNIDALAVSLNILDGSEINFERIARYIINNQTKGFAFVRKEKQVTGNNSDYIPIDERLYKIYKVYENGELQYDSSLEENHTSYRVTRDGAAIEEYKEIDENKMDYGLVWRDRYLDIDFRNGFDYVIDGDFGWKVIPSDIQEASELLIQDMKNDSLRYINRYIESFDNGDFKIKFAGGATSSTGNVIVDKILEKYKNEIRLGVL